MNVDIVETLMQNKNTGIISDDEKSLIPENVLSSDEVEEGPEEVEETQGMKHFIHDLVVDNVYQDMRLKKIYFCLNLL